MFLAGPVDIASADVKFAVLFSAASSSVKLKKMISPLLIDTSLFLFKIVRLMKSTL